MSRYREKCVANKLTHWLTGNHRTLPNLARGSNRRAYYDTSALVAHLLTYWLTHTKSQDPAASGSPMIGITKRYPRRRLSLDMRKMYMWSLCLIPILPAQNCCWKFFQLTTSGLQVTSSKIRTSEVNYSATFLVLRMRSAHRRMQCTEHQCLLSQSSATYIWTDH